MCLQIQVTAAVANFLVNEARKNFHAPANVLQEQDLLIYNFCPEYTGKVGLNLIGLFPMIVFPRRSRRCLVSGIVTIQLQLLYSNS